MAKDYGIGQQIEEQQIDVYVPEYDVTVKASPAASANVVNNLARMKVGGGQKGYNNVGGFSGTSVGDAIRSYAERVSKEKSDLNPAWIDALYGFGEGFTKGVARFPMDITAQLYDLFTSGSNYMTESIHKGKIKDKKDRIIELQARIKSFDGLDEERKTKATKYYTEEINKLQEELKMLESDNFSKYIFEVQKERKKASDAYAEKIDEIVGLPKNEVASGFESVMTSLLFAPAGPVGLGLAYGTAGAGGLLMEMKEKGVDSDTAMRWSTIGGGLIGWANTIGDKFILTKAIENITAKSGLMAILRGATAGGLGELIEEGSESILTDVVKEISGIGEKSAGQVVGDAILAGLIGFASGFVFGTGSAAVELKWKKEEKAKNVEKFKKVGISPETSEKIAQAIYDAQDSNAIKEEVANLITEDIDPSKYKDADMQKDIDETVSIIPEMMNRFLMQNEVEIPKAEVEETKTPVEEKEVYTISGVDVSKETMPKLHDLLYQAEASGSPITTIAEALQKINEVSKFGEKQKLRGQLETIQQSITNKLQRRFGEAYGRSVGQVVAANVYAGAKLNGVTPEQYYQTMFPKTNFDLKSVEDLEEKDEIPYQDVAQRINEIDAEEAKNGVPEYTAPTININGVERQTTNSSGEPIAKSEKSLRYFYNWFGDSKVVDKQGRPLVVYHGTNAKFESFDKSKISKANYWGEMFYFGKGDEWIKQKGYPVTMPVYLSLKSPFILKNKEGALQLESILGKTGLPKREIGVSDSWAKFALGYASENPELFVQKMNQAGYDGLIVPSYNIYGAFEPNQIKSIDNRGTFSGSPNIYYQSGSNGFKEWFGKSEAVDENGNPKKMYHWTPYNFDIFKIADNDVGFHVGSSEQAERIKEIDGRKGEKKEIFIRVENPLELEDAGMWAANSTFVNQLVEKNIITEEEAQNILTSKDMSMKEKTTFLRDKIKENGYDSIKYKNEYEKDGEYSYILFDENQAKYTNNKTYSRTSKDMRYQELGETPRGAFDPKQNFVYLFENADRSTFLHEMAHAWMDIVVNGKTERAKATKKAIDEFIGNKGEPYTKAQLEKFAEGFEVYCSEGKAPNNFLKNAFRNFRNWLVGLWKSIKSPDVQLNDEIRQVYKDMLGGNDVDTVFSDDADLTEIEDMVAKIEAIEAKRQEERAKKIEESADAVAEATEQSNSVKQYVGNVIDKKKKEASAFSKAFEYALKPISTRAKEVDPAFALRIRKYMLDEYNFVNKYAGMVKPLFDAYNNMDIKGRAKLDIYMKNAYQAGIDSIVQKYGLEEEYKAFRDAMEGIYQKAIDVGLQMNHRDVYAPRRVKDKQEFLEYMNSAYASLMSQMKEELGDGASIDQKAEWLDQHLRTAFKSDPMKSIPGNAKERTVDVITPELNKYYYNTMDSIAMYIENMAQAINLRNMWGATKDTMGKNEGLDKSVGEVIAHLKEEGRIETVEEENEVRSILDALLGNHGNTNAIVSAIKSGAYINMLTRGSQTISQLADIGTSAYRNGLIRTLQAMFDRNITIEDVGIEKLTEELRTKEGVQKWLELGLKVTGFSALDVWGKNTYLNARYNKLQSMAKKNPTKLKSELEWAWEDETDALINDLAKGEWTERVQLLMFSELSEVQPTTKAEMPAGYLNNPNGRVLYMLKTFAIRRMDMILNDTVRLWKDGNKTQAVSNLVFISLLMGGAEALVSILRDFIKGKPLDLNDATIEAMLGLVMMNRYQVYKASEEGWSGLAATFLPPMFPMESAFIEDMFNMVQKGMNPKDMRTWSYIPLVGDAYYWWIGGGYEKNKKKRLKK